MGGTMIQLECLLNFDTPAQRWFEAYSASIIIIAALVMTKTISLIRL